MSEKYKTTNFYSTIKHRLEKFSLKLINEKIMPWYNIENGLKIEKEDGSFINYKGIKFSGSARDVFWSNFIEPFLKNEFISIMEDIKSEVLKINIPSKEVDKVIKEIVVLYEQVIINVYNKMADVDQALRGEGYPQNVEKVDVNDKIDRLKFFINENSRSVSNLIKISMQNLKASENIQKASILISIVAILISVASVLSSNDWQQKQIPLLQKQINYLQKINNNTENLQKYFKIK